MNERVQLYRWVREVAVQNRYGKTTRLAEWESQCSDCGLAYRTRTLMSFKEPKRRCEGCKAPGIRTGTKPVPVWPEGGGGQQPLAELPLLSAST